MKEFDINVYTKSEDLPNILQGNFFHSLELFQMSERVPSDTPYMAVATKDGEIVGQLLIVLHRHHTLFPPFIYMHAHAHGEGIYKREHDINKMFPLLLNAITTQLSRRLCLYIEFSDLSKKMFGYRHLRKAGYFPIAWQEVYNSLHSKSPEERLSEKTRLQIADAEGKGAECHLATQPAEALTFHKLYKNFYRLKPRKYVPSAQYFQEIQQGKNTKLFITTYHGKIIGGCTCAFTEGNAYLWHLANRRKRYGRLHPDTITVWHAIQYAHAHGCAHIHFMDVGLPWKRNPFRDFIRSFGGKPVAKFRWFRFNSRIINRTLKWFYKD